MTLTLVIPITTITFSFENNHLKNQVADKFLYDQCNSNNDTTTIIIENTKYLKQPDNSFQKDIHVINIDLWQG